MLECTFGVNVALSSKERLADKWKSTYVVILFTSIRVYFGEAVKNHTEEETR